MMNSPFYSPHPLERRIVGFALQPQPCYKRELNSLGEKMLMCEIRKKPCWGQGEQKRKQQGVMI